MAAGADRRGGLVRGRRSRTIRVYDGEVESLIEAGEPRRRRARLPRRAHGYAYGTDLGDEALPSSPRRPAGRPRRRSGRVRRPPRRAGGAAPDRRARRPGFAAGRRSASRSRARGSSARARRATSGSPASRTVVYVGRGSSGRARELRAASPRRTSAPGLRLRAGVRRRGTRSHDRASASASRAGRTTSTPRRIGDEAADRALALLGRASPSRAPARWCSTRSSPPASWLHRRHALAPTQCSAGARCSPASRASEIASGASRWSTTALDPEGSPARRSTARASPRAADGADRATAGCCSLPLRRLHRPARRGGPRPATQRAAPTARRPRSATRTCVLEPGEQPRGAARSAAGDGVYVTERAGPALGSQPGHRHASRSGPPAGRSRAASWPSPLREMTIACDLVVDAPGDRGARLGGPLGAVRRQRQSAAAADRGDDVGRSRSGPVGRLSLAKRNRSSGVRHRC